MHVLLVSVAAFALAQTPAKLASPGLTVVGINEKQGDFFSDYFAEQLTASGQIRVTTKSEVSALVGFERQKQLLGCSEKETSCLAELAGALGVDGLIVGSLAKTTRAYAITLKIVGAQDGRTIASGSTRVKDDDALLDWLSEMAKQMAPAVVQAFKRAEAPRTQVADAGRKAQPVAPVAAPLPSTHLEARTGSNPLTRWQVLAPGLGGLAAAGVGAAFYARASGTRHSIDTNSPPITSYADLTDQIGQVRTQQTIAFSLFGVGAAGLAVATFFALQPAAPASLAVVPTPGGGLISFGGAFP